MKYKFSGFCLIALGVILTTVFSHQSMGIFAGMIAIVFGCLQLGGKLKNS